MFLLTRSKRLILNPYMKKLVSSLCLLFLAFNLLFAQMDSKEIINGKEFYKYEVKDGDNLYRISKAFSIPQEEIIQFNPPAQMGVKMGMKLLIPTVSTWNVLKTNTSTTATKTATTPEKTQQAEAKAPVVPSTPTYTAEKTKLVIPGGISSTDQVVYKIHIVQASETVYKIIKQYDIDQATLIEHNPSVASGLRIGEKIKIPASLPKTERPANTEINKDGFIEHTIEAKENWYSISRKYIVSVEELKRYNPELGTSLNIGQIMKIPKLVNKKTDSQKITPAPKPSISISTPVYSPVVKPAAQTPAQASLKTDTFKPADKLVRIALLLPFMLGNEEKQDATIDKFVEFYEGVLLAVNQLKEKGVSIELNTFDTEKSEAKVREVLIRNTNLKKMDLIIGPAYSAQVNAVTQYGRANKIPVIVPFTSKIDSIGNNPFIFQNNCPQSKQLSKASQLFTKAFASKNIIIINFNNDTEDEGSEFARSLKNQLKKESIAYQDIQFTQESFNALDSKLIDGKETVLLLATDKALLVKDLLPKIAAINSTEKQISVFGFSKWSSTLKSYPSTYYYTPFFINRDNKENALYRNLFRQEFGLPSTKDPRFDLMGFDLVSYFASAINIYGKGFTEKLSGFNQTNTLQSKFNFVKLNNGGYINDGVNIVHFDKIKGSKIVE